MEDRVPPQPTVDALPVTGGVLEAHPATVSVLHALGVTLPLGAGVQLRDSTTGAVLSSEPLARERPERYQLLGEIGHGGMGAVLKGRDQELGRDIAVKMLLEAHRDRPDLMLRFVEEARIAGQLQHPGIVPVYELGQFKDQQLYFTMKLVQGHTLASLLAARTALDEDRPRFLKSFEQVCQTLGYAHARGVIHRDLKPDNVMVGAFGEVQVMDWGLAKILSAGGTEQVRHSACGQGMGFTKPDATHAGAVMGTPAYMAPEQARGEVARLDERCDVFGLGAILCTILTGQPPYLRSDGNELIQAAQADLTHACARLDRCGADAALIRLTRRCLAPDPADRPRDAGALAAELSAYLNSVEQRLRQAELASVEARTRAAEERTRRELTQVAQKHLQQTLTRQVAERLEGELSRLAMVGHALALLMEQQADWREEVLVRWLDALLQREDRLFGLFLAFEPDEFQPGQSDYGLYEYRGGPLGEIRTKHLNPPTYPYRDLDFYATARTTGQAHWTEPFLDKEGGDIPMVCYTVPIHRQGRFVGIANVDISVKYFERLGGWLRELDFGQVSHGFVISRAGLIISHPQPAFDFAALAATDRPPRHLTQLSESDEAFQTLARRILVETAGSGTAIDPTTGRPATWEFARVQPAGWTFVAVIDEPDTDS